MNKQRIDILLADNQPLTVAGIQSFLTERKDTRIAGIVSIANDLSDSIRQHNPDVLIVDYNIPGFITIDDLRQVAKDFPSLNVLVVSSDNDKETIVKVLQLGVKGYLTKECSKEEVWLAVQSAAKGEKFFCHKILDIIMKKHFPTTEPNCDATVLTERETEVLKLVAKGRSTRQIADRLHLSPHTVQTHRKSIIRKLNIKSPTEFVIYAMDLGIIPAGGM